MSRDFPPVRFIAEPTHVREVSLLGTADLAYWRRRLAEENLVPADCAGHAQILIIAATMKFLGVRFTEVNFSVLLSSPELRPPRESAFLIQAFNSCRFFAFCERVLFATPYQHGNGRVSVSSPVAFQLMQRGEKVFEAKMQANVSGARRPPSRTGPHGWEGAVFLPESRGRRGVYFVRIKGQTRAYPFVRTEDVLTITPSADAEALRALLDSQFSAQEWLVREDATHGKSRTFERAKN